MNRNAIAALCALGVLGAGVINTGKVAAQPALTQSALPKAGAPAGAPDRDKIVVPELIADTTAVVPGQSFTVGVHYKIQPEWHIYWKNPGGSGLATEVTWGLPPGTSQSETIFPAPMVFESPGPVLSYGYADETMLMLEAKAPENLPESGNVQITAKTKYLMCSDRCLPPATKQLTLTLPVAKDAKPANAELFKKYKALVPKKAGALPAEAKVTADVNGSTTNFELTVTPPTGKALSADKHGQSVYFYPADSKGFVIEPPKVTGDTKGDGAAKVFTGPVKVSWNTTPGNSDATEPVKKLTGLLSYQTTSPDGATKDAPTLVEVENLPVQ